VLDKRLFQQDLEAEGAYLAACACHDAAKHAAMAEKRHAAASDGDKALNLRQGHAKKCAESAAAAREAAERARAEAAAAGRAAVPRQLAGVRPMQKALLDAAEAEALAASAARWAAEALGEVTLADVIIKEEKVVAAVARAREKGSGKALEKAALLARETAAGVLSLAAGIGGEAVGACLGVEEEEEDRVGEGPGEVVWGLLASAQREELVQVRG